MIKIIIGHKKPCALLGLYEDRTIDMRLLKILLLIPILGYGGVKAYIWYKVKDAADTAVSQMAPFADVEYDSVFSSLDGAVGIEGLVIRPRMTNDEFTVQELGFSAGSLIELWKLADRLKEKKLPEHLGLEMKKIKVDLNSELFSMLGQMQGQAQQGNLQSKPFLFERMDAVGCGNVEGFGIEELTAMGYSYMEVDVAVGVGFQEEQQRMNLSMHMKDRDLYSVDISSSFHFDMAEVLAAGGRAYEPAIAAMTVEYKDTGYHALRNEFCAKKRGDSVEQYIDANIAGLSSEIGAAFPKKVIESYRQFMTNGGVFRLSLNPAEETKLSGMEFYEAADVMNLLGVEIAINGVVVDRSKLNWDGRNGGAKLSNKTQNVAEVQPPKKAEVRPDAVAESVATNAQFRAVRKSELARHIGKHVQVETAGGKQRQGLLESVDKERIRILMKLGGGEFSFPVKLADIEQARIYM